MNVDNIRRVIKGIRSRSIPNMGFNMETFCSGDKNFDGKLLYPDVEGHLCNTTACGAGWAIVLFDGQEELYRLVKSGGYRGTDIPTFKRARDIFGIDDKQAYALFYQHTDGTETPEDFIAACEHLIEHGEVRWPTLDKDEDEDEEDE